MASANNWDLDLGGDEKPDAPAAASTNPVKTEPTRALKPEAASTPAPVAAVSSPSQSASAPVEQPKNVSAIVPTAPLASPSVTPASAASTQSKPSLGTTDGVAKVDSAHIANAPAAKSERAPSEALNRLAPKQQPAAAAAGGGGGGWGGGGWGSMWSSVSS